MALQVVSTAPRSPSPVVPGAWPSSSGSSSPTRRRSMTCPVVPERSSQRLHAAASLSDPLHLEHVRSFHQRLSRSLFQTESRNNGQVHVPVVADRPPVSNDVDTIPSDGSDMTRFTHGDTSASLSACADASLDTAWSSGGTAVQDKLPASLQEISLLEQGLLPNMLLLSDPLTTPESVADSLCLPSLAVVHRQQHRLAIVTSPPRSPLPSPDQVSPILFSSPVSSNHALPLGSSVNAADGSQTFDYFASPSWETSYGSFLTDADLSRIHSSDPPLSRPASLCRDIQQQGSQGYTQPRTPIHDNAFINEAGTCATPMPTKLSIEHNLDTDREDHGAVRGIRTTRQTLSTSVSSAASLAQGPPALSSPPPSPPVLESDGRVNVRILAFPSPTISLPHFTSSLPSPALESSTADSSTIEYAAAIVSSVLGSDISIHADYPDSTPVPQARANASDLNMEHEQALAEKRRTKLLVTKLKSFSQQVKRYFHNKGRNQKTKETINDTDNATQRPSHSGDGTSSPHPIQFFDGLPDPDILLSIEEDGSVSLPAPPGLMPPHTKKPRPSLTAHTYTSSGSNSLHSAANNLAGSTPPFIRITSSSFSDEVHPPCLSTARNAGAYSIDHIQPLEPEARPKTLAEIKSKRRVSLPALSRASNLTTPSGSSLAAISRQGPSTTMPFAYAQRTSLMTEQGGLHDGYEHAGALTNIGQEGKRLHRDRALTSRSPPNGQRQFCMTSGPVQSLPRIKKKHRRFSLSALSTLINHSNSSKPLV
ncbi:hypothetical protein Hypma_015472 [Hypsizygus marmoreus]|uniref:Uncharacterized protein n=1 Tax=Hypsizygus marmoreus TaxID=39966 RepID=A0A369K3B7_HYPMA|nr:hypothetical protein Hypma_015472 [Hypsizygus marmoreus]